MDETPGGDTAQKRGEPQTSESDGSGGLPSWYPVPLTAGLVGVGFSAPDYRFARWHFVDWLLLACYGLAALDWIFKATSRFVSATRKSRRARK